MLHEPSAGKGGQRTGWRAGLVLTLAALVLTTLRQQQPPGQQAPPSASAPLIMKQAPVQQANRGGVDQVGDSMPC